MVTLGPGALPTNICVLPSASYTFSEPARTNAFSMCDRGNMAFSSGASAAPHWLAHAGHDLQQSHALATPACAKRGGRPQKLRLIGRCGCPKIAEPGTEEPRRMAVYVDDMQAPLGDHLLCHMLADT